MLQTNWFYFYQGHLLMLINIWKPFFLPNQSGMVRSMKWNKKNIYPRKDPCRLDIILPFVLQSNIRSDKMQFCKVKKNIYIFVNEWIDPLSSKGSIQPGQPAVLKIPIKYWVLSKIIKLDLSEQLGEQLRPVNKLQMVQVVVLQQGSWSRLIWMGDRLDNQPRRI